MTAKMTDGKRIIDGVVRGILRDIEVELGDEFDRNFERQGFFSEKWQRRTGPVRSGRSLLVDSGDLRRSIRTRMDGRSIQFRSDLVYAAIHNDGGEIRVTERMLRYFWYRYSQARGGLGRRKDGSLRKDRRNGRLTDEADFWKAMALKKVGSTVKIPRRRFLGMSREVEAAVREIIEENLEKGLDLGASGALR